MGAIGSDPGKLTEEKGWGSSDTEPTTWIRDEVSVPQLRGGKGDGVVTTPNPLPTKQMRYNDLTRRATLIMQSNASRLSDTVLIV